jgi:hypothetical protein
MNDFNRTIFTETPSKWETVQDIALAVTLGISLCMLVLHGLDALFV